MVGRFSDRRGARPAVIFGLFFGALSGAMLLVAGFIAPRCHLLALSVLLACRLILGVGESLTSTGATLWSISANGSHNTAKIISYNGVSTYGGMALGAPLGVWLNSHWGLGGIGIFVFAIGILSLLFAVRKPATAIVHGEHLPIRAIFSRVAACGMVLALGGVGFSSLSTFVTLYYVSRHWAGAALCLTAFGLAFIVTRLLFINTIALFGSFPVAMASLSVELAGLLLIWSAPSPSLAMVGSAMAGCGYSLVFPSIGMEVVRRVPVQNRGAALGIYTGFVDVSFFLTGPTTGAMIGWFGYSSVFVFAIVAVLLSLGLAFTLWNKVRHDAV
jgi:MFS family permease